MSSRIARRSPASVGEMAICLLMRVLPTIVSGASQWRHPPGVSLLRVTDLNLQLPIALIWRKDDTSPLLTNFRADVKALVERSRRNDEMISATRRIIVLADASSLAVPHSAILLRSVR